MIPLPVDWKWAYVDETYVMTSERGVITYRECCRPLRSVRDILAELRVEAPNAPERLITDEGEYAAFVTVPERSISIGIVFGDDFYALLVGRGDVAAIVRTLTREDTHSLGVRRRRFPFTPPPGWSALAMRFHAVYLRPGFPRPHGMLGVIPALPRHPDNPDAAMSLLAMHDTPGLRFSRDEMRGSTTATAESGLAGTTHELRGTLNGVSTLRFVTILEDAQYLYPVTLDTTEANRDDDLAVFQAVVSSIVPLPGRDHKRATAALAHFSD